MKTIQLQIIVLVLLASCSNSEKLSDAYGNFEVDDIIVSSEASGKLLLFNVEEGKSLKKMDLVGVIDTTQLVLQKKQLKAQSKAVSSKIANIESEIKVQEQQKKNLLVDKNRIEKLLKDGAATQKQLDDVNGALDLIDSKVSSIKTQYASVMSEMEVIKTQVSQVEESIIKCKILNPTKGTVLEKYSEQNEITAFGKPLYKLADTDEMILRVYVSGVQLAHLKIGQEVEVLVDDDARTNRSLSGHISWISESAEFTPKIIQTKEERVNMVYAVKVRVKNDGTLKIGMPGEVNFISGK
ncbi:MAG: HlyD family efflux transporter periplasmic adaptor subunit [Bacteroidales bacterium]|nr:HlyD family efflux transporter periplasmic adaptor subunit [Bacteroidales bacterium]MCF8403532.1 HlyD family efflux transporter periplasmic adaptor subunit [Bacteroidales bacterium]